jgi:hypothetical protein
MVTDTSPNRQSEPVILSELEDRIIQACLRYQFTTVLDHYYLHGCPPSLNQYRRVMAGLAGGKKDQLPGHFLYKYPLPKTRWGNATRVFVPGEASRELLAQWADEDGMTWNYPARMQNYSYSYVYHNLAVVRLAICAALFCRDPAYTLEELRLWHDMQQRPPRLNPGAEGAQTSPSVIPDLWIYLKRVVDGLGPGLWFEVDNSTTFQQTFLRRLRARLSLFESAAYAEYFGTPAVLCCYAILAKSPELAKARLENLLAWTNAWLVKEEREEWASKFRFAVIEYETLYEQKYLFTAPLWAVPGSTSLLPLIPPPPATENTHGHNTPAQENHTNP